MDQPYLFPAPATEPPTENYRPTVVYRLPPSSEFEYRLPASTRGNGITARRLFFHLFLLGLTWVTAAFVGSLIFEDIWQGVIYSFTVLTILAAHEMGHYIACRWYNVEATLPYFIPMPISPAGTFGAFIKMKSPILTRRALFDIGIAGPLAGYVFAVVAAFIGHYFAQPASILPVDGDNRSLGDLINYPLLFTFFQHWLHLPARIELNPPLWAAWIGVFMTALNLLPVGQLDGGHVIYAIFGRRGHQWIGRVAYFSVIGLAAYSIYAQTWNYVLIAVLLTIVMRFGHPPVVDEEEPIGLARMLVALISLLIFILSFLPMPISL